MKKKIRKYGSFIIQKGFYMENEFMELNSNMATTFANIPMKILKRRSKNSSDTLQKLFMMHMER